MRSKKGRLVDSALGVESDTLGLNPNGAPLSGDLELVRNSLSLDFLTRPMGTSTPHRAAGGRAGAREEKGLAHGEAAPGRASCLAPPRRILQHVKKLPFLCPAILYASS